MRAIPQLMVLLNEQFPELCLIESDGSFTSDGEMFIRGELRKAKETGLCHVTGVSANDSQGNQVAFYPYDHPLWRIAGYLHDEEMTVLRGRITGRVEQAFPYLFFDTYEDALWWRLQS